ncbi:MAG TPA: esterase-like activity of phytase family protein [Gillisia sp.]|nr:esterase-like activity of phytase family protein [Gillisia sp.]
MRKLPLYILLLLFLTSCGTTKIINNENVSLRFLDDFIIPSGLEIKDTKVGGLSGIEFHDGEYYLVCDHPGNPRIYKATIEITGRSIDTVSVTDVVLLDKTAPFIKGNHLDLEGIRVESDKILLSSEGSIQNGKDPSILYISPEGNYMSHFTLPEYFLASGDQKPRNNGVFEGLAESFDQSGYWAGIELPLVKDGSKPKLFPTRSPVRITHFDKKTGDATKQFVMQLEHITKIPWMYFATNGLTELLEYAPDRFLVLERAFSAGHGTNGNTVRIFDVDASQATNTVNTENLRKTDYTPANKNLIFDFKPYRKNLKEQIIDNLEGMTFGPDLPNGNKTVLLVSDDNFSSFGRQITQIILMELEIKDHIKTTK